MMSKFKVGDRVRCISDYWTLITKDKIYVLTNVGNGQIVYLTNDGNGQIVYLTNDDGDENKCYDEQDFELVEEKTLSADELFKYIKQHGITKVLITEKMKRIPKNTVFYMGISKSQLDSYSSNVNNKNEQFNYKFCLEWGSFWHEDYKGRFVVLDDEDKVELISPKEKLIKNNMEEIKTYSKEVLKEAEDLALSEIEQEQVDKAKAEFKRMHLKVVEAEKRKVEADDELKAFKADLKALKK